VGRTWCTPITVGLFSLCVRPLLTHTHTHTQHTHTHTHTHFRIPQNLVYELWLAPYRRVMANDSSGLGFGWGVGFRLTPHSCHVLLTKTPLINPKP
jgi:hypothetical protein